MDTDIENCINVHCPSGIVKFTLNENGIYAFKPGAKYLEYVAEENAKQLQELGLLVSTVKENRMGFTDREFREAVRACDLYHKVGCPTVQNFKALLKMNFISNCPVTPEHVDRAEKIFGPDVATLKGKSTRQRPKPVRTDWVEIPPEIFDNHPNLIWCMDIMYVNGMPFLTGIDKTIRYRTTISLSDRTADTLYEAIDVAFRQYNKAGFTISWIYCDGEFKPLMNQVIDELDVQLNCASKNEHVGDAERNNRTAGDHLRTMFHHSPYDTPPKVMLRYMAFVATSHLNWFPAKGGVSPYYSPHVVMGRQKLDYNKHCQFAFGAYVQAEHEEKHKNTNAPRTLDAILLTAY